MPSSAPLRPEATRARYETLLEVSESIASHRQLSTLFADLSRCLKALVTFDFISLTLIDETAQLSRLHVLHSDRDVVGPIPPPTPLDQTPTGLALRTRQPLYVPLLGADDRFPVIRPLLQQNGIQSI